MLLPRRVGQQQASRERGPDLVQVVVAGRLATVDVNVWALEHRGGRVARRTKGAPWMTGIPQSCRRLDIGGMPCQRYGRLHRAPTAES